MQNNTFLMSLLLGFALLLFRPALACYSGLLIIPTADSVGANQYDIELQTDGITRKMKADTYLLNMEFGFGNRVEVGVDVDLHEKSDDRLFVNGKFVFAKTADGKLALAGGICNSAPHLQGSLYLVATGDCRLFRITLGAMNFTGKHQIITGIDKTLNPHLTLMADYSGGKENYSSVGLNYHFNDRIGIMAGVEIPNDHLLNDQRYSIHLIFNGPVFK